MFSLKELFKIFKKRKKKSLKVLLAYDFKGDIAAFKNCKKYDFDVKFCEKKGEVVLNELVENSYDILVVDVFTKGVDAYGILQRFDMYLDPKTAPSVIVISDIENEKIEAAYKELGAFAYMNPAVSAEELIAKVDEIEGVKHENKLWAISNGVLNNLMII